MTNNERINAMSVEEKAKFINNKSECDCCIYFDVDGECRCPQGADCEDGIKAWLEDEVK